MEAAARGDRPDRLDAAVANAGVVIPTVGHGVLMAAGEQELRAVFDSSLAFHTERDVLLVQRLDG